MRLWFLHGTATQPIISQLSHQFNFNITILQANVEYIKNHIMGIMLVALKGDKSKVPSAIHYLQKLGIQLEVIGYVPNHIISCT